MKRMFEHRCAEGHITDHYVEYEMTTVTCTVCGTPAVRIISAPRIKLEGWSGHFPTAASKWERQHENAAKEKP